MFFSVLSCFSCVWLLVTPWAIAAHQTPLSMKFSQARILEWIAISFSRESYSPRNQTWVSCISCIVRQVLYHSYHLGSPFFSTVWCSFIHGALGRVWGWWVSLFSDCLTSCFIRVWIWPLVSFFPFTTKIPGDSFPFYIAFLSQKLVHCWGNHQWSCPLAKHLLCILFSPIYTGNDPGWYYLYLLPIGPCCTLFHSRITPGSILV